MKNIYIALLITAVTISCNSTVPSTEPRTMATENITQNELGKTLFYTKCSSCHMVNKELTGPALKGVEDRWPDKKMLYKFIRNSEEVIQTDAYAKQLWLTYNETPMTAHLDLTDADIAAILDYINQVSVQ